MKLADGYEERLATFTKWPHTTPSAKDMAAAGWIHLPPKSRKDTVIDAAECPYCDAWESHWYSSSSPIEEHEFSAFDCPFDQELTKKVKRARKAVETQKALRLEEETRKATELARKAIETQEALRLEEAELDRKAMKILEARRLEDEARIAAEEALEASMPKASANDIGFFDPTLVLDLPEIHLYATSAGFLKDFDSVTSRYQVKDILALLPKCLRGPAFTWFKDQDQLEAFTCLNSFKKALAAAFPIQKEDSTNARVNSNSDPDLAAPHSSPQYHNCSGCFASFSSLSRLLAHTQKTCSKVACKHCEESFASNNKLHEHVRLTHSHKPVTSPATPSRPLSPPSLNSSPKFVIYPTASLTPPSTPSPSHTSIRASQKAYMTMNDLFAMFAEKTLKTRLLAIQTPLKRFYMTMDDLFAKFVRSGLPPASPLAPGTSTKAPKTPTASKSSKSKVFETKSDSAPRTVAPANRNSTSTPTPPATPTASKSSKSDIFKIRSTSASLPARKPLPNHIAPTSAQNAPRISRFSPRKPTPILTTSESFYTPSRVSLLCALIRATIGQLRLLIAPHWPHRPPLKRWDIA